VGFHASRARFDLEPATYRPQALVLVAVLEQHTAPLQQLGGLAPYLSRRAVGRGAESAAEGGGEAFPLAPWGMGAPYCFGSAAGLCRRCLSLGARLSPGLYGYAARSICRGAVRRSWVWVWGTGWRAPMDSFTRLCLPSGTPAQFGGRGAVRRVWFFVWPFRLIYACLWHTKSHLASVTENA
jgi:hypothetical protein